MLRLTIVLYALYTLTSVAGLAMVKSWLPGVLSARATGDVAWNSLVLVGMGMLLYITSFVIWMVILSRNQLSTSYPVAIGLTLVFTTIVSALLLHETITAPQLLGIGLVIAGIALIF
jgi:drug/metabolite transporter (DMT)-like permease